MNAIKLYGQQTSSFEYIKMMLNRFAKKANLDLQIEEIKSTEVLIQENITSVPAIRLNNNEVLYYHSNENINEFIKNAYKKIFTPENFSSIKNFLVPIDFSETSLNAADYALNLAKDINAVVTLLHCYVPHVSDAPIPEATDTMDRQKDLFDSIVEVFESEHKVKDLNAPIINTKFEIGFPGEIIINEAHKMNATVIMGNTGTGNIAKKLFGSVSTKVISDSKQPTLIIPPDITYEGFNEIAYAMDDLRIDSKVVEDVIELVHTSYARINLVHVDKENNFNNDFELSKLYKVNYPKSLIEIQHVQNESVSEGLNNFVAENEIDLLIMTHKKRSVLESIFKASESKKVATTSTTPVLILHT